MVAVIPENVSTSLYHDRLTAAGLTRIHQGKVRDTYAIPSDDDQEDLLLVVATDRVSIFDFVLPVLVPNKGEFLTALTVFWLSEILGYAENHLVAFGSDVREYIPLEFENSIDLGKRALVVRKLSMIPVECIVRGYLTGSGLSSYQKTRQVCGIQLPEGLHDGSRLPEALFTPTTKAETGHDVHMSRQEVKDRYGNWIEDLSLDYYRHLAATAKERGIIVADTKLEFGEDAILADEVGTPDSSRFWDVDEWERAVRKQKSPLPYDKEVVRNWGKEVPLSPLSGQPEKGLHHLDPENTDHLQFVSRLNVPEEVVEETTFRYRVVFERLTGLSLPSFQRSKLALL